MKTKPIINLLYGLATFIPGFPDLMNPGKRSARYFYSVWMRHLVMAHHIGITKLPDVVAELGPGSAIGLGLSALLSGTKQHFALDVAEYASVEENLAIFDQLVQLFHARADIPDDDEFPRVKPKLESYQFPQHILTDTLLADALDTQRLNKIRASISNPGMNGSMIEYFAPWNDTRLMRPNSVDMLISQAVMEHVADLSVTYEAIHTWLKPDGLLSQQVDFKSHGTSNKWDGHWTYSDMVWKLMQGKRPYWINREPHSTHLRLLDQTDFNVVGDIAIESVPEIKRSELAPRFRDLSDQDLSTSGAFIQARPA